MRGKVQNNFVISIMWVIQCVAHVGDFVEYPGLSYSYLFVFCAIFDLSNEYSYFCAIFDLSNEYSYFCAIFDLFYSYFCAIFILSY